jgi:hypothetical protein
MQTGTPNQRSAARLVTADPALHLDWATVLGPSFVEEPASKPAPRSRFRAALARFMSSMMEGLAAYGHAMNPCADFYYTYSDYWDLLHDESRWSETRFRRGEWP